jgi:hypothetical protein
VAFEGLAFDKFFPPQGGLYSGGFHHLLDTVGERATSLMCRPLPKLTGDHAAGPPTIIERLIEVAPDGLNKLSGYKQSPEGDNR